MKNTITIDGVTIELTKEQVEKLKVELGVKKKSPFERVRDDYYYVSNSFGVVEKCIDAMFNIDDYRYNIANYCTDKDLLTKRAKEEVLNRLLWRFSMENDGDKTDLNDSTQLKYYIYYDRCNEMYSITFTTFCDYLTVCFYSKEIAQRAIDEIIIPFNEGKLPCCEIWKE